MPEEMEGNMPAEEDVIRDLEQDFTQIMETAIQAAGEPPPDSGGQEKRGPGAPMGNQNARKHGLYSDAMTPEQQELLDEARNAEDLGEEIALLRVKLVTLAADPEVNHDVFLRSLGMLARLIRIDDRVRFGS